MHAYSFISWTIIYLSIFVYIMFSVKWKRGFVETQWYQNSGIIFSPFTKSVYNIQPYLLLVLQWLPWQNLPNLHVHHDGSHGWSAQSCKLMELWKTLQRASGLFHAVLCFTDSVLQPFLSPTGICIHSSYVSVSLHSQCLDLYKALTF